MKEVHLITQGKGGVGKSLISSLLAQYLSQSTSVHCYDTDPVNPTFSRYKALAPETVRILNESNNIDSRNFDGLIEKLIELDGVGVVDNGAATFVPLMSYLAENDVPSLLAENDVHVVLHMPIAGGQALEDCLVGLDKTLKNIHANVVIWLNDFQGKVSDRKAFTDFKVYKDNKDKVLGLVHIVNRNPDTFGHDIKRMTELNLTFDEVADSAEFSLMPKQRLRTVQRDLYAQLDQIPFLATQTTSHAEEA